MNCPRQSNDLDIELGSVCSGRSTAEEMAHIMREDSNAEISVGECFEMEPMSTTRAFAWWHKKL